jgi:hypothetical protein
MAAMTHPWTTVRRCAPFALLLAGCASVNTTADLAENELLYVDVPFATKAPGDRALFVAPVVDARDPTGLPLQERGFPITYSGDDFWERPVPAMVADVLRRQLADSGLFTHVGDVPTADGLILKPTLVAFTTGAQESMAGARSFAEVVLRLEVLGPQDAAGRRAVLHDKAYGNRQLSEQGSRPLSPYRLVGRALQQSMVRVLSGLDGSNVGRSAVPFDVAEAAVPASARK